VIASAAAVAAVALALVAASSAGVLGGSSRAATPLPSSACGKLIYQGSGGTPQFIIASDLPLQGAGRAQTVEMTRAIEFVLKQRGWKAGRYSVGYQSCDDSTAQAQKWDSAKCTSNAQQYARNSDVVGVIGTFNSGCAKLVVPILNRAPNGPVAMVSPANTYVGLTQTGPGTVAGEPGVYYPTKRRNYIRLVAADNYQGAAQALLAKQLGVKRLYILNDRETYGLGVAANVRNAARQVGVNVVGFSAWDGKASSYEALASKIKQSGAQGVFLGGIVCNNGGKLIKDIRAGLGTGVRILAPDGWTPFSAVVQGAGSAAEGMYISVAGQPNENLGAAGKRFVSQFRAVVKKAPDPYSVYAAQSAVVLLDAIARSDGSRASVSRQLFNTNIKGGILGTFSINANGDTNNNPVTIYRIRGGEGTTFKVITPPTSLVKKT
jgi:branched-chain amino acid transport system substrate-binding protein